MLNPRVQPRALYEDARFLGRGTCTVSEIFYTSPSRCAVADSCAVSLDRRMTAGETWESCLKEIEALPAVQEVRQGREGLHVHVRPSRLDRPEVQDRVLLPHLDQQGEPPPMCRLWWMPTTHCTAQARGPSHLERPLKSAKAPLIDKWTFSTNGVAIQGRYGIPCVGFGPGAESQAHAPNEITWKEDLVVCAAVCRRPGSTRARATRTCANSGGAYRQRHSVIHPTHNPRVGRLRPRKGFILLI
jgi:putative selenium metabolism hydrolase